jgi:hypothetical protein
MPKGIQRVGAVVNAVLIKVTLNLVEDFRQ